MAAILEPYKWHQIKKSANGNIVFSDCLCNTLLNMCIFALSTSNPVKLRIKVDYKGYFPICKLAKFGMNLNVSQTSKNKGNQRCY